VVNFTIMSNKTVQHISSAFDALKLAARESDLNLRVCLDSRSSAAHSCLRHREVVEPQASTNLTAGYLWMLVTYWCAGGRICS
jgi:hypothetical protein